jgi:uncharacterized protein
MTSRLVVLFFFIPIANCFAQSIGEKISKAAIALTSDNVQYDPTYYRIRYPGGDVPLDRGVCTDVVIRTYRKIGVDLQQRVHEDMHKNFAAYPNLWEIKRTDTNIDHRRVPNLITFFERMGQSLPTTKNENDYYPGDIVTWTLQSGLTHIGIVIHQKAPGTNRYLIVHNIGRGQEISDCLFEYTITGHYRYQNF